MKKIIVRSLAVVGALAVTAVLLGAGLSVESPTLNKLTHVLIEPTASQFYAANPPPTPTPTSTPTPAPTVAPTPSPTAIEQSIEALPLYPVFNIPLGAGYCDFEIKGSVTNFASNGTVYLFASVTNGVNAGVPTDTNPLIFFTDGDIGDSRIWHTANPSTSLYSQLGGHPATYAVTATFTGLTYNANAGGFNQSGFNNGKPYYVSQNGNSIYYNSSNQWLVSYGGVGTYTATSTGDDFPWHATWPSGSFGQLTVSQGLPIAPSPINQLVFTPSKLSGSSSWMYKGNPHLIWSYLRISPVGPEADANGKVIFSPIMPVDWRLQPTSP